MLQILHMDEGTTDADWLAFAKTSNFAGNKDLSYVTNASLSKYLGVPTPTDTGSKATQAKPTHTPTLKPTPTPTVTPANQTPSTPGTPGKKPKKSKGQSSSQN